MDGDADPSTLEGYLDRLRDGPPEIRASTLKEYRNRLEKCERLLGRPLASATPRNIKDLNVELRKQMSGPGTARVLRRFYQVNGRPDLAGLCVLKERVRHLRPDELLSPREVKAIIGGTITRRDAALVGVLWDTGARISDVLALRLSDVGRAAPTDSVPLCFRFSFATKKTDTPVEAWVRDSAVALEGWLKVHPFKDDPDAPLFCTAAGGAMTERRALQILKDAARRAKIVGRDGRTKRVFAHLFRHSRTSYMLRLGMNESSVKRLMGWAPRSQQIARYTHIASEDAYRSLLEAEGVKVPPREEIERVSVESEEFLPVVPVIPSGTAPERIGAKDAAELERIATLLEDPEVRGFLVRRLRGAKPVTVQAPRGSAPDAGTKENA